MPGPPTDARWRAALELLLGYFVVDDLAPDTFERQLLLLADSDVCPCFSGAAWRVLDFWHLQAMGAARPAPPAGIRPTPTRDSHRRVSPPWPGARLPRASPSPGCR